MKINTFQPWKVFRAFPHTKASCPPYNNTCWGWNNHLQVVNWSQLLLNSRFEPRFVWLLPHSQPLSQTSSYPGTPDYKPLATWCDSTFDPSGYWLKVVSMTSFLSAVIGSQARCKPISMRTPVSLECSNQKTALTSFLTFGRRAARPSPDTEGDSRKAARCWYQPSWNQEERPPEDGINP